MPQLHTNKSELLYYTLNLVLIYYLVFIESVSVFIALHHPERVGRFLYDGKNTLTLTKIYKHDEYLRK